MAHTAKHRSVYRALAALALPLGVAAAQAGPTRKEAGRVVHPRGRTPLGRPDPR